MKTLKRAILSFWRGVTGLAGNIRRLGKTLARMIYWGWFMRDSYDWDFYHLEVMMLAKLKRMRKEMTTNGHCSWCVTPEEDSEGGLLNKLDLAIYLLNRQVNRNVVGYAVGTHAKHDAKWGEIKWDWKSGYVKIWRDNASTPELETQERQEYRLVMDMDDKIYSRDRKILYYILEKHGPGWWD